MSLAALGLPVDADKEDVKTRFRELARVRHPDRGGTPELFNELQFWVATAELEIENRVCKTCANKGYTLLGSGFSPMRVKCMDCA